VSTIIENSTETSTPVIRQLSQSVINKIAAGEVIERPASVAKELLENAVDSGATRIDVTVEQGGIDLIRVVDNGCGISESDLPLAVAAHATSKIQEADDLFRVSTLGFRGEALASIAEVSRTVIRSRTRESDSGAELEIVGGKLSEIAPCGTPVGTTIEVHNLFFNTPVRRKFFRATQTEMGHTAEAFTRLALAHPHIHFTLRHGTKLVHDLPPTDNLPARVASFFGEEVARELIWVESFDGTVHLSGYVARPSQSRGNNRLQYLFINGRCIRDRALQHALGEAYRGLLLTGRFPICFLQISMPPEAVDVNVHPTKLEVRFQDGGKIYSQLLGTLRTKFLTSDLTARLQPTQQQIDSEGSEAAAALNPDTASQVRRDLMAWAKGELPDGNTGEQGEDDDPFGSSRSQNLPLNLHTLERPLAPPGPRSTWGDSAQAKSANTQQAVAPAAVSGTFDPVHADAISPHVDFGGYEQAEAVRPAAIQVHNRYLIAETADGLVVIDQHALHERVLYEQIREKVLAGAMECQRLLVPEPVDLGPAEAAAVLAERATLAKLGIEVEPFGGDTILVTSYPAMLANFRPTEVLRDLVDHLMSGGKSPERRDLLDELLHMISCKSAIKAGDRLSQQEVAALVQQRHLYQDSHHCPHGRPTALVFTRDELDRQFKRT